MKLLKRKIKNISSSGLKVELKKDQIIKWRHILWKSDPIKTTDKKSMRPRGIFQDNKSSTHTDTRTIWSRFLFKKLTGSELVKKFPVFYGTWRFITAFTSARHLSLTWATSIQSMPSHHTSWRSILILSSHLRLGLPSDLLPSGFHIETMYKPLLSPYLCYMPRPSHIHIYTYICMWYS